MNRSQIAQNLLNSTRDHFLNSPRAANAAGALLGGYAGYGAMAAADTALGWNPDGDGGFPQRFLAGMVGVQLGAGYGGELIQKALARRKGVQ